MAAHRRQRRGRGDGPGVRVPHVGRLRNALSMKYGRVVNQPGRAVSGQLAGRAPLAPSRAISGHLGPPRATSGHLGPPRAISRNTEADALRPTFNVAHPRRSDPVDIQHWDVSASAHRSISRVQTVKILFAVPVLLLVPVRASPVPSVVEGVGCKILFARHWAPVVYLPVLVPVRASPVPSVVRGSPLKAR